MFSRENVFQEKFPTIDQVEKSESKDVKSVKLFIS